MGVRRRFFCTCVRLGAAAAAALLAVPVDASPKVVRSTTAGFYRSQFGSQGAYFTDTNDPNSSSAVYKAVVLPDLVWNTTNGTWNTSTANWTTGSGPNDTFSDGSQAMFNNASGGVVTLASNLTSSGGTFEKPGSGVLTVSGSNTYSGGTTLTAGTLTAGTLTAGTLAVGNASALPAPVSWSTVARSVAVVCSGSF